MIASQSLVVDVASVAAHYDDLDLFYRTIWGAHIHHGYWVTGTENVEQAVVNLTELVAREACLTSGDRVCDIGCGYGGSALIFAREHGARVTGITISKKQYQQARSAMAGAANIEFLFGDAATNGLAAESFDAVVSIESSEHMPDKPGFFAEVNRLLRPGGRFVVAAWLTREHPNALERKLLLEPICVEGRLPSMASASEYKSLLQSAGLTSIEFQDLTRNVKKTWSVCAFRFMSRVFHDTFLRRLILDPAFTNRVFAKTLCRFGSPTAPAACVTGSFQR